MPIEIAAVLAGVATACKYTSDYLKLRKDRRSGEQDRAIRDYIDRCRRQEYAETLGRFDLIGEQLAGFEQLLRALSSLQDEQATIVLKAIEEGNISHFNALKLSDEATHAKLDRIIYHLGIQPRQLYANDYASWRDQNMKRFEEEYLVQLHQDFGQLEMLGVPPARGLHQKLDIAYVNLELTALNAEGGGADRAENVLPCSRRLTIRGPAGSGKTTLLRWIAYQCAGPATLVGSNGRATGAGSSSSDTWKGGVPLFVPLRKLRGADQGKPNEKKLHEYAFDAGVFETAPNRWLQTVFSEGRAVLLLDGVDEIPSASRRQFWNWLRDLLQRYQETRVFVTSRPLSANTEEDSPEWQPPANFNHAELKDLSPNDRRVFIQNWHDAAKAVQPDSSVQLDESRDKLLEKLDDRAFAHVRDLCKNPLTAGLICALYWRKLKLPETRRELYEISCDMLMEIRDEFREIRSDEPFAEVTKADRSFLLQCLAWEMMQNTRADEGQNIEVPEKDARVWLENHLARCRSTKIHSAKPKQVLDFLVQRSGLLRVPTKGFIDFHHRSFQEYLAACAAAALGQLGNLIEKATNDQWRDTIILAANTHVGGVPFGHELTSRLLKTADREVGVSRRMYIALAAACLSEMSRDGFKTSAGPCG